MARKQSTAPAAVDEDLHLEGDLEVAEVQDTGEDEVVKTEITSDPEEGIEDLRAKLAAERESTKRERELREAAERRELEAKKDVGKFRTQADKAQFESLTNAHSMAENLLASAEDDLAAAMEAGDFRAAAKAQTAIARATQRLDSLEVAKEQFEARKAATPAVEPDEMVNATPATRDWIKRNPQFLTDQRFKNRAVAAHYEAVAEGIREDTAEYFEFVDDKLAGNSGRAEQTETQAVRRTPAASNAAAPARSTPGSARATGNQVRLTAAQLEAAEIAGLTAAEYAAQLR